MKGIGRGLFITSKSQSTPVGMTAPTEKKKQVTGALKAQR